MIVRLPNGKKAEEIEVNGLQIRISRNMPRAWRIPGGTWQHIRTVRDVERYEADCEAYGVYPWSNPPRPKPMS